jgi:hypothetical protein
MTANVAGSGGVPDSTYGSGRRHPGDHASTPAPAPAATPETAAAPPRSGELMLSIDDDPVAGGFVYTTIDRRTGAVVQKLSRAELLKLREATTYAAGAVLSTRA